MGRKNKHAPEFKAKVALAAVKGQKTIAELCQEYSLHESMIHKWKSALQQNAIQIFSGPTVKSDDEQKVSHLHSKIGELLVERDFLKKALKM
jgi:transposase-like protein